MFSKSGVRRGVPALLVSALGGCAVLPAAQPDPVYMALRSAAIEETFVVENIALPRDAGVLTLKSGNIGFTKRVMGRDTVAVFLGEGEFTFNPPLSLEQNYLKNLTGETTVKEAFDRAVFCFTDDFGNEVRGQAKTKGSEARMAEALRDFRKHIRLPESTRDNIEASILADLYRPGQPGFFSAYLHGRKHNDLRFHINPRGAEPGLSPEEVMLINAQPLNVPDEIWYLSHAKNELASKQASSNEDHRSVQVESYQVETTIAANDHFTASAKLKFTALAAGERVLPLALVPTLRVSRASLDGQDIPFIQEDKKEDAALSVVLPQPLEKGSTHELLIEYQGDKVVHKEGGGNFAVGARESWYPNVNSFKDHARYDLTFKVPRDYTLVSIGKLAKEWREKDMACTQWISEAPVPVAGFNYGTFKKKQITDQATGINIEGYATSQMPDYLKGAANGGAIGGLTPSRLVDQSLVETQNALRVFSAYFGKSEFSRIAITQQPEFNFGQSWPSLVYLPLSAYLDSTQRWQLMGGVNSGLTYFVEEVTPHEVSHQWWGHMVGWGSYHDQWLSEGFAEFSAGLYLEKTEQTRERYLKYWDNARLRIVEKNNYGHRANDAGPLWLGLRLSSEKNRGAYSSLVYRKGGYVLHMLRQMMFDDEQGDKYFIEMMQDFVHQFMNRNATTEDFIAVAEKHLRPGMDVTGNHKLDWFFKEWVYGTAIPKYKFDYTVTPAENGKFLLKATLAQSDVPNDFVMIVPLYLDFDGRPARAAQARLVGNSSIPVQTLLPKKPRRVLINANHDVLEQ